MSALVFDDTILRDAPDGVVLVGGTCDLCQRRHFPALGVCPQCGGTVTAELLPRLGVVEAVTLTELPLLGAAPPVTVVLVQLDPDVLVQGVATAAVAVGDPVRLVGRRVPSPSGDALAYGFERAPTDA